MPEISVIIPTYNRAESLKRTLKALATQDLAPNRYEVIVVDDASSDDTGRIVRDFIAEHSLAQWQYLRHGENGGRPSALNSGILAAGAPLVAFIDDDLVPCRNWVSAHVARHQRETRPAAVVGKVSYPEDWIAKSNLIRFRNSRYIGHNKDTARALAGTALSARYFAGGNSSLSRTTLIEVGMFDARMRRGQDGELAFRLQQKGLIFVYAADAAALHYAEAVWSYKEWVAAFQKFYFECAPEMIRKHHDVYYQTAHWFVEPSEPFREPLKRTLTKLLCRSLARPRLGRWIGSVLAAHDSNPLFYRPLAFKFMLLCAAVGAVNMRRRKSASET